MRDMLFYVLVTILLLSRDTMTKGTLFKKAFNWGLAYSFRGWIHDHHDKEHGSRQAGSR